MLVNANVQIAISIKPKLAASALLEANLVAQSGKVEFLPFSKFALLRRLPAPTSKYTWGRINLRFFGENQKIVNILFVISTYLS